MKEKDNKKTIKKTKSDEVENTIINNKKADELDKGQKAGLLIKEKYAKKNNNIIGFVYSIVTFVFCLALFGCFYNFYLKGLIKETTKLVKEVTVTDSGIADSVEKVYDSVVVVETYVNNKKYSTGTGFVFKTDNNHGYILTNNHVIAEASNVVVTLTNGEKVEATVIGSDEYSDIAVLGIEKKYVLSVAQIADVSNLRVGDTTFTVGSPIDSTTYSWSVTRGILSGKDRLVEATMDDYSTFVMEVIQTDAAINAGNSGGPLCNSNGEVIGITNMKLASSTIEGMGFAIPIDTAVKYAENIIKGKKITRPYLGVTIYDSTNYFSDLNGVYIESVEKGSSAYKSGLKSGDKIIKINNEEITSVAYFKYNLYKYSVGEKITITYERNGKEENVKITLKSSSLSS